MCSDQLVAANIPQELQEQSVVTAFGGADGLLCVVSDNSPARGAFFRDPVSEAALTAPQVVAAIDAASPVQPTSWLSDSASPALGAYTVGAPVLTSSVPVAPVMIPAASPDGRCAASQSLPFLTDVEAFSCAVTAPGAVVTASTLQAICATTLNGTFVRSLSMRAAPNGESGAVAIAVMTRDGNVTGTPSWAAAAGGLASIPNSQWDPISGTCNDAVTTYQLQLTVSGDGTISSATAYVGLDSVHAIDLPALRLSYGAKYVYDGEDANAVRPTSGRPGYVRGLPLIVAEGAAVRTAGLKMLPRSPLGACATSASAGGASTVRFGEDLATSCTLTQTAAELEAYCLNPPALADQPIVASLNVSSTTQIGVYGDSHPSTAADWVPLSLRYPQNDAKQVVPAWDATTRTCSQFLSALHLRVLYAEVGSTTTPIRKVVGAEIFFDKRTVQAASCAFGSVSCPPTVTTITATATFNKLESSAFAFVPESPQLIPPLPYDFFYPFFMSSNPARR